MRYRRNRPETMWHGTSSVLARHILSQGFVPDPKKKRWSPETGHLASYYGTYFTDNWMTAYSASTNTTGKFTGNPVIIEAIIELRSALVDEDHIPDGSHALARGNNWAFLPVELSYKYLELGGNAMHDLIENGVETFRELLESKFQTQVVMHPGRLYGLVKDYLLQTVKAAAAQYNPDKPWDSPSEYQSTKHETPAVRAARDAVVRVLRGLMNDSKSWDRNYMNNVRVDTPVGFTGANRIVNIVEIVDPKELIGGVWHRTSSSARNPTVLIPWYGRISPEFLENFDKHIGGHRVLEGEEFLVNPPITLPPEATGRERAILQWIYEFWAARDDWGCSEHVSPLDAERAAQRMNRAVKNLQYFGVVRARGPMPTPEAYIAKVWKKYHPPEQELQANPGLPTYDKLASKPGLSWEDLGYEGSSAQTMQRKYGPPAAKDIVYHVVSSAYKAIPPYGYNLSKSEEWARMHQDTAERLSSVLPVEVSPQEAARVSQWMLKNKKIGMDEWDKMTELVCRKMRLP